MYWTKNYKKNDEVGKELLNEFSVRSERKVEMLKKCGED